MPDIIALNGTPDGALSAETLTRRIEILAGTGLAMQLNALVVERQLRIDAFPDDPVLAAQAREQQDRVKRDAKNTLSRLMPDFLRVAAVSPAMAARSQR